MRVCIVGASGKPGQYMVQHALERGYEVAGVCRDRAGDCRLQTPSALDVADK